MGLLGVRRQGSWEARGAGTESQTERDRDSHMMANRDRKRETHTHPPSLQGYRPHAQVCCINNSLLSGPLLYSPGGSRKGLWRGQASLSTHVHPGEPRASPKLRNALSPTLPVCCLSALCSPNPGMHTFSDEELTTFPEGSFNKTLWTV